MAPQTFAQRNLKTFGELWSLTKGVQMNTTPLPQTAPLVGTPNNANSDLLYQARREVYNKGQNRQKVLGELIASTRKSPAAVTQPAPAQAASGSGFGGSGYSGNAATQLGHASNPGSVTPATTTSPTYASPTPSQFPDAKPAGS